MSICQKPTQCFVDIPLYLQCGGISFLPSWCPPLRNQHLGANMKYDKFNNHSSISLSPRGKYFNWFFVRSCSVLHFGRARKATEDEWVYSWANERTSVFSEIRIAHDIRRVRGEILNGNWTRLWLQKWKTGNNKKEQIEFEFVSESFGGFAHEMTVDRFKRTTKRNRSCRQFVYQSLVRVRFQINCQRMASGRESGSEELVAKYWRPPTGSQLGFISSTIFRILRPSFAAVALLLLLLLRQHDKEGVQKTDR